LSPEVGADPGLIGLAASSVLVVVAVAISMWQRLGLERSLIWSACRALVQLLVIGAALALVVEPGQPIVFSWIWVVVMVTFASWTLGRRAPEVPGAFVLGLIGFGLSCVVTLSVLFGFRIFEPSGRTIVPLAGLVVGNSLAATVLVGRRIVAEASERRAEIEARLSLGLTGHDALRPYVRDAVRTALIPQIETTKAVGIVFLPGAMVGLILAGASPVAAVKVQVAVMYLILGSVSVTTAVVALGLSRRLMTPDHRLVRVLRAPSR
jgi:putative ABC transport system permease protein